MRQTAVLPPLVAMLQPAPLKVPACSICAVLMPVPPSLPAWPEVAVFQKLLPIVPPLLKPTRPPALLPPLTLPPA